MEGREGEEESCSSWYVINICTKRSPLPVWYVPYQLLQDFLLHEKFSSYPCYPWYQKIGACHLTSGTMSCFTTTLPTDPPGGRITSRRYPLPPRCQGAGRHDGEPGRREEPWEPWNHGWRMGSQDGSTDTWWKGNHSDVSKSPNWGCGTSKWPKSMAEINGGDPKYLQVLWWSAKCLVYLDLPFACKKLWQNSPKKS